MAPGKRPNSGAFLTNLRAPMPLRRKLRLLVSNNWLKLRRRSSCCGHPGEPGC